MKKTKKTIAMLLAIVLLMATFPVVALGVYEEVPIESVPVTDEPMPVQNSIAAVGNLRVNYQLNPVGVDANAIRFGWRLYSDLVGHYQVSYRIILNRVVVDGQNALVWDSGVVTTRQAQGIQLPANVNLQQEARYEWIVAVVDNFGNTLTSVANWFLTGANWDDSEWIMPAKDSITNLGQFRDAGNTWMVANADAAIPHLQRMLGGWFPINNDAGTATHADYLRLGGNPLMRMEGELYTGRGGVAFAKLYMTAIGDYIPYINGERVMMLDPGGREVPPMFAPGFTDFNRFINYQTFDVTEMLQDSTDIVLGARVSKGAYAGRVGANAYSNLSRWGGTFMANDPGTRNVTGDDINVVANARRGTANPTRPLVSPITRYVPFTDTPSRTLGLRARLVVTFEDGTTQVLGETADQWRTTAGPAIFNDYFNGEIYCARRSLALRGWNNVGFEESEKEGYRWFDAWGGPESYNGYQIVHQGDVYCVNDTEPPASLGSNGELRWISYPASQLRPNNTAVARFAYEYNTHPVSGHMYLSETRGVVFPVPAEIEMKNPIPGRPAFPRGQVVKHPINLAGLEEGTGNLTIRFGERVILEMGQLGRDDRYNRGQNMVGVLELYLSGTPDAVIGVRHAELLNDGTGENVTAGATAAAGTLYYAAMRGNQNQVSFYRLSAEARQLWRPLTKYSGFQFVEIYVDTPGAEVTLHGVTGRVITSAHNRVSELTIEGPGFRNGQPEEGMRGSYAHLLNQLYENIFWGMMGNWITLPIDCPQRPERVGWAGDAQIFAQTAILYFDTVGFYENYIQIMNENVRRFGNYGAVMPQGWSNPAVATGGQQAQLVNGWSDAGIVIPWQIFLNTGDTYILSSGWEHFNNYIDRVWYGIPSERLPQYQVNTPGGPGTFAPVMVNASGAEPGNRPLERWNAFEHTTFYGDWLSFGGAHLAYMNAVYQIYHTLLVWRMAEVLGETERAMQLEARYNILREAFLQPADIIEVPIHNVPGAVVGRNPLGRMRQGGGFVYDVENAARFGMVEGDLMTFGPNHNTFTPAFDDNAQTGLLFALLLGLYHDEEHRQHLVSRLDENVRNVGRAVRPDLPENTLTVGFLGVNMLLPGLSLAGLYQTAYDLFLNDSMPTWLYSVRSGATTMWERWNSYSLEHGFGPTNMNSFNHFAYGASAEWMFQFMAGIIPDRLVSAEIPDTFVPGFRHFYLQPQIDKLGRIDHVELSLDVAYGDILVEWRAPDGFLSHYRARVPANTTATLFLPATFETEAQFNMLNAGILNGVTWVGPTEHLGKSVTQFELVSGDFTFVIPNQAALVNTIAFTQDTPAMLARLSVDGAPATAVPTLLRVPVGETVTLTISPVDAQYGFLAWGGDVPEVYRGNATITLTPTSDIAISFSLASAYYWHEVTIRRAILGDIAASDPNVMIQIAGETTPRTLGAEPITLTVRGEPRPVAFGFEEEPGFSLEAWVINDVDFEFVSWTEGNEAFALESKIAFDIYRDFDLTVNFAWAGFDSLSSRVNNPAVHAIGSTQANTGNWAIANIINGNLIPNSPTTGSLGWSTVSHTNTPTSNIMTSNNWMNINLGDEHYINRIHIYPRQDSTGSLGRTHGFPMHFTLEVATEANEALNETGITNATRNAALAELDWQPVSGVAFGLDGRLIISEDGRFNLASDDVPFLRPLVIELDEFVNARHVRLTGHLLNDRETATGAWHMQLVHIGIYADGEPPQPQVFAGTNPNVLRDMLAQGDVILATSPGNLGIFAHHSPFEIPVGRTLTVATTLNVQGNAQLVVNGTLVVQAGGRVNNQGGDGGTIKIAEGGTLVNYGHVENVTNSTVINYGTIVNNHRFEVRAGTRFHDCGEVVGTLNVHRNAIICNCFEVSEAGTVD